MYAKVLDRLLDYPPPPLEDSLLLAKAVTGGLSYQPLAGFGLAGALLDDATSFWPSRIG